jgi:hypothetical protein
MADTWNAWSEIVSPLAAKVTKEVGASRRIREALAPTSDAEFNELDKRWHEVRPSFFPDAPTDQPMAEKSRARQVDAAVSVAVDVSASQRHAVRVEFHRLAVAADLVVLALQPIDGKGAAAIDGFALIVEDDGGVVLRGDVPDGQASGTYVGAIVERGSGRHTGGVTLTLRG